MPVHKIEDFTEGELLFTAGGLTDFVEERKQIRYVPVLRPPIALSGLADKQSRGLNGIFQRAAITVAITF